MTRVFHQPIPEDKMYQFHEILCVTGGRYINNPIHYPNLKEYRVSYIPGDHVAQSNAWNRITQEIRETRKDQMWLKVARRFKRVLLLKTG